MKRSETFVKHSCKRSRGDRTKHRNLKDIECKKDKENAHIEFKDIALKLGLGFGLGLANSMSFHLSMFCRTIDLER